MPRPLSFSRPRRAPSPGVGALVCLPPRRRRNELPRACRCWDRSCRREQRSHASLSRIVVGASLPIPNLTQHGQLGSPLNSHVASMTHHTPDRRPPSVGGALAGVCGRCCPIDRFAPLRNPRSNQIEGFAHAARGLGRRAARIARIDGQRPILTAPTDQTVSTRKSHGAN